MNEANIRRLAADPRFIPGVYNYCDRWCERCSLSHRCLTYAMEADWTADDPEVRDVGNQKFWNHLHEVFQLALEMIRTDAAKRGVDLDGPDTEFEVRQEARQKRQEAAENHPLLQGAKQYGQDVDRWFESAGSDLRGLGLELETLARLGAGSPAAEGGQLREILQVIQWYQYFITAKLTRAVSAGVDEDAEGEEALRDFPRDSDGSAKIALIALDRSLAAWTALRERLPSQGDNILDLLVLLARLRRGTEARFPQARAFLRPGFDDSEPPGPGGH